MLPRTSIQISEWRNAAIVGQRVSPVLRRMLRWVKNFRSVVRAGQAGRAVPLRASISLQCSGSILAAVAFFIFTTLASPAQEGRALITTPTNTAPANFLTATEKADGWKLLWDGKSADGWRSTKAEDFPARGWTMTDGVLTVQDKKHHASGDGGDIITRQRYSDFELVAEFKITPGANSGIKIFVQLDSTPIDKMTAKTNAAAAIGCEFQVLDDALHPDAKLGKDGNRTIGSLYDLIPAPKDKKVFPVGEWNHARILSRGKHVEFWLNGVKTVEFERGSEDFRKRVAASKYHDIPEFGEWADGHILLQDHGDEVSYRNIKIRVAGGK